MKAARESNHSKQAPAIGAETRMEMTKSIYRNASILLPTETQSVASLAEYTWPMTRVIAGFTKGRVSQEQSVSMRNACRYRDMLRPLVNAARVRTGIKHVELVTKTACNNPVGLQLIAGQCALIVHGGKATWLRGTANGKPRLIAEEPLKHGDSFKIQLGLAMTLPTATARQQLRAWGFNPRVLTPTPFSAFGVREEVIANANRKVNDNLAAIGAEDTHTTWPGKV